MKKKEKGRQRSFFLKIAVRICRARSQVEEKKEKKKKKRTSLSFRTEQICF